MATRSTAVILALGWAVTAGCVSSNLNERPAWAQQASIEGLPPGHRIRTQYASETHLLAFEVGTGPTLVEARAACREAAVEKLGRRLSEQVLTAVGEGEAASAYQTNVRELATANSNLTLSFLEEILSWDGYEEDLKYAYGMFALEKKAATNRVLVKASAIHDGLMAVLARIEQPGLGQKERERLSLDALHRILELSVIKEQCHVLGLGERTSWIDDFSRIEFACAEAIAKAGRLREQTGDETDLREAHRLYTEAAKLRLDPMLDESIARIEGRLPCEVCKPAAAEAAEICRSLNELRMRLHDQVRHPESGRLSVEFLRLHARLSELCEHEHDYFKERTVQVPGFAGDLASYKPLEQTAVRLVHDSGAQFEAEGTEQALEQALKLYEDVVAVRKDQILAGRILDVKRKLPCVECGRTEPGVCVQCEGARGRTGPCSKCRGNRAVRGTCSGCGGDGLTTCGACGGRGLVGELCPTCQGGKVLCTNCAGRGKTDSACTTCNGVGTVTGFDGRIATCGACGGSGKTEFPCFACLNEGKVKCSHCNGTSRVDVRCNPCGGEGRAGKCPTCGGAREIDYPCDTCSDGTLFYDCEHCKGSGKCPTCGGRGHRP